MTMWPDLPISSDAKIIAKTGIHWYVQILFESPAQPKNFYLSVLNKRRGQIKCSRPNKCSNGKNYQTEK